MKKSRNKNIKNLPYQRRELRRKDISPKKILTDKEWEEFRKTYEEKYPFDEPLTGRDKEYIKTRLVELNNVKKAWYLHSMKTWTKEDYENYEKFYRWMFESGPEND